MTKDRFSIILANKSKNTYRQYMFLSDSNEIKLRIFHNTMNFIKCCDLPKEDLFPLLNRHLTSLCHKVNMVKHHLGQYTSIERNILKHFETDLTPSSLAEGTHLIEMSELTAEYESFLFQIKATLDILVGFLNLFYRKKSKKSLLKNQFSFANKGQDVFRSLMKYLKNNPDDEKYLKGLVGYLKEQCIDGTKSDNSHLSWLFTIIDQRDEIAHFSRPEHFAFQINNIDGSLNIYPPHLTLDQTIGDSFKVVYENLLIFLEDFIALLLSPYLNKYFVSFTHEPDQIKHGSPRWYIMLKVIQQFGLRSVNENPYVLADMVDTEEIPISISDCIDMHIYYNSFYK